MHANPSTVKRRYTCAKLPLKVFASFIDSAEAYSQDNVDCIEINIRTCLEKKFLFRLGAHLKILGDHCQCALKDCFKDPGHLALNLPSELVDDGCKKA